MLLGNIDLEVFDTIADECCLSDKILPQFGDKLYPGPIVHKPDTGLCYTLLQIRKFLSQRNEKDCLVTSIQNELQVNKPQRVADVSDEFLAALVSELDNEDVTAIVLKGSCARGDQTPFSDVDLTVFVRNEQKHSYHQRFYRNGRLISVGVHTIEYYRKYFLLPKEAVFVVPSIREAQILLDKDGSFNTLQQEARDWTWEPLQEAANNYVCEIMLEHTEIVHKALRAFFVQDNLALSEMTLLIFFAVTEAVIVQRGILSASGNSYFHQAQASMGVDSAWTHYHKMIAGINTSSVTESLAKERGIAALRLYQETANILRPTLRSSKYFEVIDQTIMVIEEALAGKQLI